MMDKFVAYELTADDRAALIEKMSGVDFEKEAREKIEHTCRECPDWVSWTQFGPFHCNDARSDHFGHYLQTGHPVCSVFGIPKHPVAH